LAKYKGVTLNAIEMITIAEEMRKQNTEPNDLMPYSEFGAASATYAVINAIESIGKGLAAEEKRKNDAWMANMKAQQEWQEEHSDSRRYGPHTRQGH
jgi:hypothetical protein